MNSSLRFGWDADLVIMNYIFGFQWIIETFVVIFLHSSSLYILLSKQTCMTEGIRRGYIVDQIGMIFFGITVSCLIKMYPIYPWPGFFCDGLVCKLFPNIEKQVLCFIAAIAFISIIPCYHYLTLRIYSSVVSAGNSSLYFGQRAQNVIFPCCCIILWANSLTFGLFGEDGKNADEIFREPEIKMILKWRGGRLVAFGAPGDPALFAYAVYLIFATSIFVCPFIFIPMEHARRTISKRKNSVSSRSQEVQDRVARVFFVQIFSALIFFCFPLITMFGLLLVDTSSWPSWLLATIRPTLIMLLTLNSTIQSSTFLLKNPQHTKRIFERVFELVNRRDSTKCEILKGKQSVARRTSRSTT